MRSVAIIGTRGYPSYYGGFETLVRKLSPYLVDHGWDVRVYSRPGAVHSDDPELDSRVESIVTPGLETKSLSTLSFGLTSSIHAARTRPDVALVMNVANGFWLPLLRMRGIATAVNVDGIEWDREKWGTNAKRVFRAGASLTARYGDELIYDSTVLAERWNADFNRVGNFIPYGGTVPGHLDPVEGLARRSYVLIVARFVPENSISEFLDAAETLSKEWNIVIVGSSGYGGEIERRIEELCKRESNIQWLGHVSDDGVLFALWQNAGAYFHGHSVGGTNPALVQAMACGSAIVARDTLYNREVLGESGVYVQPNGTSIAKAIHEVMLSPTTQDKLSSDAIERAQRHYSWNGVCEKYNDLLERLSNRRSEGRRLVDKPHSSRQADNKGENR